MTDKLCYTKDNPWYLVQDKLDADACYYETVFSQSNGFLGVRAYREEQDKLTSHCREGYLAGVFAAMSPMARKSIFHQFPWDSRQMVSLPEIFSAQIFLDGEEFALRDGEFSDYRQVLDMQSGILSRSLLWTDGSEHKRTTRLTFQRFLSAHTVNLAVHNIQVESINWSGDVEIIWEHNLAGNTVFRCGHKGKAHIDTYHYTLESFHCDGSLAGGLVVTNGTQHKIACISGITGSNINAEQSVSPAGTVSQMVSGKVDEGEVSSWSRYTAITHDQENAVREPLERALEVVTQACNKGYDLLVSEHCDVWHKRWELSDIKLDGPAKDQIMIRFGLFSLLQMAPYHNDNLSVPARCYSFNRYNGHYFWDGEIFLLPFYQFCAPDVAKNLLKFRCNTLPGAKRNAEQRNSQGAVFAWQSDSFGAEQAPWGLEQYLWHQSADIIYAFDQYAQSSGDEAFMFNDALEALAETARFWVHEANRDDEGLYHLPATVGPDESHQRGPDNGYTSLMARRSLEISLKWWTLAQEKASEKADAIAEKIALTVSEFSKWQDVASNLYIPDVPGLEGVPLQDAFFMDKESRDISSMTVPEYWKCRDTVQVIKQADIILAMYLLEDNFTPDQLKCGYEFYEPKTLHVSSLSLNTHSIVASILGKQEEAYDYFKRAAGLDLDDLNEATQDGLHAAALGAVWQMVVPGFSGLRVRGRNISLTPNLPNCWKSLEFAVVFRGWTINFRIHDEKVSVKVSGKGESDATISVKNEEFSLADLNNVLKLTIK